MKPYMDINEILGSHIRKYIRKGEQEMHYTLTNLKILSS